MKENAQKFFKESRKTLMFTQKQLAQALGCSIYDVKNYEYGNARVPGDYVLQLQAMLDSFEKQSAKPKNPSPRTQLGR